MTTPPGQIKFKRELAGIGDAPVAIPRCDNLPVGNRYPFN